MKREKVTSQIEQQIVVALVVSVEFLSQMAPILDVNLLQSKHFQIVAKWALDYFGKYEKAPQENIEGIYHAWVSGAKVEDDLIDSVHEVLENLSESFLSAPNLNIPYLLDSASKYLSNRKLEALKDVLEYHLESENLEAAEAALAEYHPIASNKDSDIDPFNCMEAWDAAYADSQASLIEWKDPDARSFFGNAFSRDALIAILAPEKRGKTWFCLEFAFRALSQRKKVALFEVGDMSTSQIMRRIGVRLSKRPSYKKDLGIIKVPRRLFRVDGKVETEMKDVFCDCTANSNSSKKAVDMFLRANGIKPKEPFFKLSVHPNSSVSTHDISAILKKWELYEGFVADVVIIDYADILAPEPGTGHFTTRDQVNSTWKALRRMSQEKHCLVIAPTQADAASYNQPLLDLKNFSEDKRKLSHVTGMLGLNQIPVEREKGIMRLNWIVLREDSFSVDKCLYVGQCLKLGRPFTCSML